MRVVPRVAGVLAATISLAACAAPRAPGAPAPPLPSNVSYSSAADQICRGYAGVQKAQAADLMYDQCMYARGYLVPGFSPSPDTPGYQGPLLGPATIGGGN
jgi:hypothetical protein